MNFTFLTALALLRLVRLIWKEKFGTSSHLLCCILCLFCFIVWPGGGFSVVAHDHGGHGGGCVEPWLLLKAQKYLFFPDLVVFPRFQTVCCHKWQEHRGLWRPQCGRCIASQEALSLCLSSSSSSLLLLLTWYFELLSNMWLTVVWLTQWVDSAKEVSYMLLNTWLDGGKVPRLWDSGGHIALFQPPNPSIGGACCLRERPVVWRWSL